MKELLDVARSLRDYIDALPEEVVAALPAMPGVSRDWVDDVISKSECHLSDPEPELSDGFHWIKWYRNRTGATLKDALDRLKALKAKAGVE